MLSAIRHKKCLLTLALCAVLVTLASCRDRQDDPTIPDGNVSQALFTISLGEGATQAGRATPTDGEYNPGSGLENFIDIESGDFGCYLFTTDNVLVSKLQVTNIYKINTAANGRNYSVTARLQPYEVQAIKDGCKVVILANWGEYPKPEPGNTTIHSLCSSSAASMAFSSDMGALSADNLIPMYGVKSIAQGEAKKEGDTYNVGSVRLLRALAKVEVKIAFEKFSESDVATPEIKAVSITNCYDAGVKMPSAEYALDESGYVHGSWDLDYTPVNIPVSARRISLPLVANESTGSYIVYMPEYNNLVNGNLRQESERARIAITLADAGYEQTYYIGFSKSGSTLNEASASVDIARNNWYKFNVKISPREIIWTADLVPYHEVTLEPGFGIPIPNN